MGGFGGRTVVVFVWWLGGRVGGRADGRAGGRAKYSTLCLGRPRHNPGLEPLSNFFAHSHPPIVATFLPPPLLSGVRDPVATLSDGGNFSVRGSK